MARDECWGRELSPVEPEWRLGALLIVVHTFKKIIIVSDIDCIA
jgi:hypothetical protein